MMVAAKRFMRWCLMAWILCAACGGVDEQHVSPSHRWTERTHVPPTYPLRIVLAVDDAADAIFRADVVAGLGRSFQQLHEAQRALDPATWTPFDLEVVVLFPSRDGAARLADEPALRLQVEDAQPADLDALVDVIASLLETHPAPAGARYRLLEAVSDIVADATPWRTTPGTTMVALASQRDDDSPFDPAAYLVPTGEQPHGWATLSVVAPGGQAASAFCDDLADVGAPRLAQFVSAARQDGWCNLHTWPCDARPLADWGFPPVGTVTRGRSWCPSKPIAVDASDRAQCRVLVTADECDTQRGWRIGSDGRCEVAQLEGDALASCRTTLECDGCGHGWCVSEDAGWMDQCGDGGFPSGLRFPGKALAGAGAEFEIICELEI